MPASIKIFIATYNCAILLVLLCNILTLPMADNNITQEKKNRILYIDLIRAYAIIMMVQGHAIDLTLDPVFRDSSNILYSIWNSLRGTTAPIFFFSSGTIFSYLFLKAQERGKAFERMKKGFSRGLLLLAIGYLFQFNLDAWLSFPPSGAEHPEAFAVNVLHAIGAGIIILACVLYLTSRFSRKVSLFMMLLLGSCFFLLWPDIVTSEWVLNLPIPFQAYLNRTPAGFFPIVPWLGFMFYGAALGVLLHFKQDIIKHYGFISSVAAIGIILHYGSWTIMNSVYEVTHWDNMKYLCDHNFLFFRLGHVFLFVAAFSLISYAAKYIPNLVYVIGRNTLLIYILHIFIIYNSALSNGLITGMARSLTPWEAVSLALAIEVVIIFAIWGLDKLSNKYGKTLIKLK